MFLRKSLTGRLLIALTFIALLSIAGVGFLAFWMEQDLLIQQFSNELEWSAESKQAQLTTWFAERRSDIQFLANSDLNRKYVMALSAQKMDAQDQQAYRALLTDSLRDMQLFREGYHRLLVADARGSILAATDETNIGASIATDPIFRATIASLSGEQVRDVFHEAGDGPLVMTFAQAIYKPGSGTPRVMANVIGAVILTVNLKPTVYLILEDWRRGQTGETILSRAVMSGTQIINPLRFDHNIRPLTRILPFQADSTQAKPAQLAARGQRGERFTIDHRGVSVLTVYRYLPEPGWGLVLKMNTDEILAPLYALVRHLLQIAIGVLAVAVLGSLVMAKTLIQPLVQLMLATRFVAEGNWQTNLDVQREDEIGEVARSFQEMISSLRQNQQQIKAANDVARLVLGVSSLDEVLADVLGAARTLTGAQLATLAIYDINEFALSKFIADPHDAETTPYMTSSEPQAISKAFKEHANLYGPNGNLSTWHNRSALVSRNGSLALPVLGKEKLLGMLRLEQKVSGEGFSQADEETAVALSNYLGIALENIRLVTELQSWNRELEQKISERTRDLEAANERLQQLDRMKSEFMYSVSHELRNPLSNLKLVLELLQQNIESPKRIKYLSTLTKQVNVMTQLTEDMLNMVELEKTRENLNFVQVDLTQLVGDAIADAHQKAENKGLTFMAEFAQPNIWLEGDGQKLRLAITHLLRNAINFTRNGTIQVRIMVEEKEVCVEVKDPGIGIPPADLPHIFDRFYRGSNVSQSTIPGSGLGLSLVKEVIELHQGRVALSSQLEMGTNFQIWLPVTAPQIE